MADIKWIKLATNTYEDEKIMAMIVMPNGDLTLYVWLRLLILAGKVNANGYIYITDDIPYTYEILAAIFYRPLDDIKNALKILSDFKMIEIAPNNTIKIVNWDKHQNVEGMERVRAQNRKRAENHREKKKQIEQEDKQKVNYVEDNNVVSSDEAAVNLNTSNENEEVKQNSASEQFFTTNEEAFNHNEEIIKNTNENSSYVTKALSNVTHNESNVTVTEQNKKEIENKKKNKNKREIESEDNINTVVNNKSSTDEEEKGVSLSQNKITKENEINIAENNINSKAIELMTYHEKITGVVGGLNYVALRLAIDMHGEKAVKMAMDKALEANHIEMGYINGILKNWRREGYPKEDEEVKNNGVRRCTGKNNPEDKNEFTGFKPKKSRKLTEAERKRAEENLL